MTGMGTGNSQAAGPTRFALRLPAQTAYLAVVRGLLAAVAREHCFPPAEAAKAIMAIDEACVNVIEHAYCPEEPPAQRRLEVDVEADEGRLLVTVADRAHRAFCPLEHPVLDLDHYWADGRRKGLGLLILRTFMDHVSHTYDPARGNRLRLVKYASRAEAPHRA